MAVSRYFDKSMTKPFNRTIVPACRSESQRKGRQGIEMTFNGTASNHLGFLLIEP